MNSLTKIFIAERDCESLVNTMLWLEQYAEFDVYGSTFTDGCLKEQIDEIQPDIVILGVPSVTAEAASTIKMLKSAGSDPAILLSTTTDNNVEPLAQICDGHIGPKTGLKEVADLIQKTTSHRNIATIAPVAAVQMAKAG